MRTLKTIIAAGLFTALTASAAIAQDQAASFNAQNANVHRGTGGQPLTLPSQASAPSVVADFLRGEGLSGDTVGSLVLQSENSAARTGLTHLRFGQQVDGLTVFGAYVKATVNGDGQLVHLIEALATPGNLRPAVVGPRDALDVALAESHPGFDVTLSAAGGAGNTVSFSGDDFFYRDPTVTRMAIAMTNGSLQEGFLVETWSDEDNLLHHTLVGANGRVLGVQLRTNNDSYNIFPDHPGNSTQTGVTGPGAGNTESPIGWLTGSQTTVNISGNNTHTYLDTEANNSPDAGGSTVTDGNFLTPANLAQEPETDQNKAVAVQNLFYWNNFIHDKLYSHGFVESAGNFQNDNFGNGGNGNDAVNAEAQDGSGTNNANFSTPSDGSPGRMQMYVWTITSPKRDGDVDSDIIFHEFGHGLTWRMIGSMGGRMSGAIGEGMSDVLAILINNNDTVGEYSTDDLLGIRSESYAGYSRTYGDFSGNSVHFDGEIYAATIWRLWEIFQDNSVSQDTLFDHLIGGMNFTSAGPAFEDMRDGILAAAYGSGDECLIWQAFADFGVGVDAEGSVKGGGPFGGGKVTITEDFSLPVECTGGNANPVLTTNAGLTIDVGDFATITQAMLQVTDADNLPAELIYTVVTIPANGTLSLPSTFTQADIDNNSVIYTHTAGDSTDDSFSFTVSDGVGGSIGETVFSITVNSVGDPGTVVVESIMADTIIAGAPPVLVVISGQGFELGASVTFENGSGPAPTASSVVFVNGETLNAEVSAKLKGKKGTIDWNVAVTNPGETPVVCSCTLTVDRN